MPMQTPVMRRKQAVAAVHDNQQRAVQKLSVQLELFLKRLADARVLLEGIDRLASIFEQIGLIEDSLGECGGWIEDYLGERISYQAFTKNLSRKAAPALLEELDTLIYARLDHEEQIEELVGPLSLLEDDLLSSSCSSSGREPGVVDSILDDDPMFPDESDAIGETEGNASAGCYESGRRLLMDIELISSRLIEQIRTEGLLLHGVLIAVATSTGQRDHASWFENIGD